MIEFNITTPYYISDSHKLLVTEDYMEAVLISEGYDLYDEDQCIDSNLTCEYVSDLGFTNLGDFGHGYIFTNIKSDSVEESVLENYFQEYFEKYY